MGRKSRKKLDSLAEQLRSKGTPVMETAYDVWLAGLGALSIARKRGEEVAGKGSKMFERLVAQGQEFEKKEGSEEDLSLHSTKQSAVKAARGIARAQAPSHLVVHRADGTVQDTFSYR